MRNILKDAKADFATHVTAPTQIDLGDGLMLRSVQSQDDADRYAAFNAEIVSDIQGLTCAKLLACHPTMRWDDFFFVEESSTKMMVSCICLIPWVCRLGSGEAQVELQVAMLEMVVTHPEYRHRGLVRRQVEHFQLCAATQGFDLCIIEGIPYYYRQYGYAYACDHWASDGLALARVPEGEGAQRIRLRKARVDDIPALASFYDQSMSHLALWTTRTPEYWNYLLEGANYPIVMVEDTSSNTTLGYVVGWRNAGGAQIAESGFPAAESVLAFLQWCKANIDGEFILGWPAENTLVQVGRSLGSAPRIADQWLLRATEMPRLLLKFAPLLAARLANSAYAGLTTDLTLNLFRQAYLLRFVNGELIMVETLGFRDASMGADGGDLCIPPDAWMRLLLGYRGVEELTDAWPDIVVRASRRHLLQVLWPKISTYFWKPYMAYSVETRILSHEFSQPV